ncbi:MAG: MerR family transcriptional regulator [Candidatus Nanopelagicales bacterium]
MQPQAVEQRLTIGAVLALLQDEYPDMDVTISKIRFLEAEGLVEPGRTPTGYRKFSAADVDRLRYTLTMQRDHFLPLRVIRDHLEKIDQGWEPAIVSDGAPTVPVPEADVSTIPAPELNAVRVAVSLTMADLAEQAGMSIADLADLRDLKLIQRIPGSDEFGVDALEVARSIVELGKFGIEARHLTRVRSAAERQVELITERLGTQLASADADEAAEIRQQAKEMATQLLRLQSIIMRSALAAEFAPPNAK